ncbi:MULTISPECIES: NAD(P)/FAD-dependent oxidoreductase [Sphingobacterium]|uniref:NAD(P)/FAD-dependent oxidoreductase n=1 Tax=Sphingobacterium TaxID=28453 RepID=UPI0010474171|nr:MULTISPECIES: NAD(P)/FAD-dependent oxidoreductase [Sphingobacterium]MCS3556095.1 NADH dehydrogenase [Sphingobacterium sp. JUb21]MCW2263525.1 NADH dehydrogenase [Sphingobacterium kitahiroshimense]TCR05959.1 NADH dehydrogenase [Sphingobacterium sp. JUb78]TCR08471.1 NADH dehydrogenase [Sphingobacterium sp. JUb20]
MLSNRSDRKFPKVVIIGAGFGGIEVAKKLKNKEVEVLLLDRNNFHTFQPLMYQVATGTLSADSISFPIRKMFKSQENFSFRIAEVNHIDSSNKTVQTNIGDFEYDYLVVATGATTNFFGNQQIAKYALPMKSIQEALNIRSYVLQNLEKAVQIANPEDRKSFLNFVIVGGGPTGVELSGAIAEIRNNILEKDYPELRKEEMNVYLVEGQSKVLANLSEKSSEDSEKYLKALGVKILLNVSVTGFDGTAISFGDGSSIETKTVIWGAGVAGQFPEGFKKENIQRGNRIQTDDQCRVLDMENVYAIGDVSAFITDDLPRGLPGVAPVAQQQGKYVAKHISNVMDNRSNEKFSYFDKGSMATIGRAKAVVDMGKIHFNGFFGWIVWMFVHLMSIFGFRNKVITFINWTVKFFTKNSGVRLIFYKFNQPAPEVKQQDQVLENN